MTDKQLYVVEGDVTEALPNTTFKVKVTSLDAPEELKDKILFCALNGKMRRYHIRVMPGDSVKVEVSPYDFDRGRITFRNR